MNLRQGARRCGRALRVFALGAWVAMLPIGVSGANGAVLVMFDQDHCPYCERWHAEIGAAYPKTEEGRLAPLRRVDIHAPLPADLPGLEPAHVSPVFVLWHDGRELGRIQGYPGEDFFWPLLGELLAKLDTSG